MNSLPSEPPEKPFNLLRTVYPHLSFNFPTTHSLASHHTARPVLSPVTGTEVAVLSGDSQRHGIEVGFQGVAQLSQASTPKPLHQRTSHSEKAWVGGVIGRLLPVPVTRFVLTSTLGHGTHGGQEGGGFQAIRRDLTGLSSSSPVALTLKSLPSSSNAPGLCYPAFFTTVNMAFKYQRYGLEPRQASQGFFQGSLPTHQRIPRAGNGAGYLSKAQEQRQRKPCSQSWVRPWAELPAWYTKGKTRVSESRDQLASCWALLGEK